MISSSTMACCYLPLVHLEIKAKLHGLHTGCTAVNGCSSYSIWSVDKLWINKIDPGENITMYGRAVRLLMMCEL